MAKEIVRCGWSLGTELMIKYHDTEWGVPVHDDNKIFEFMVLDAFQAGLSWSTILNKRENFRKAFDNFNPEKVAKYKEKQFNRLMNDAGIIRNRAKITSAIINAQKFLEIQKTHGSFDKFIWQFTDYKTLNNQRKSMKDVPAKTNESDAMSKELIKHGFKFVGSTICYAFMQAAGMVNDHVADCFRHKEVKKLKSSIHS